MRVLDAGGWTDTWFAGGGTVCNLAVSPGVEVVALFGAPGDARVDLTVTGFGDRYSFSADSPPGRHPLLEAVVSKYAPRDRALTITVSSAVPPGASLGTSASVVVAMIAALQGADDPRFLARTAHEIETVSLGLQSGVQDQVAASFGGCNLIVVDPYPATDVTTLQVPDAMWDALAARLVTVYLGAPHQSGAVHEMVIKDGDVRVFERLRDAARAAAAAALTGDIDAYGAAMKTNTELQATLHPSLVSPAARRVIEVAERFGSAGWKVNGAGGDGGTVTVIGPPDPGPLIRSLDSTPGLTVLRLRPTRNGVTTQAIE